MPDANFYLGQIAGTLAQQAAHAAAAADVSAQRIVALEAQVQALTAQLEAVKASTT